MKIDLNNPIFVAENSPQAEWKHALLIDFGKRFGLNMLVETGTSYGDTVEAVCRNFNYIHSIELSDTIYMHSYKRFEYYPNVSIYHGSSDIVLPNILKCETKPFLIWLDAHLTGGESAGTLEESYGPLANELREIRKLSPKSLVLIDDCAPGFRFNPSFCEHVLSSWVTRYFHGIAITHENGEYEIPEVL